ncbi:MAG: hypothetical protein KTR16_07445 [Acidiferrobacterales bacterium]|nr:hypothetical protein [Acidiferrobacterales bacterium]
MINLKWRDPDQVIGQNYMQRWHLMRKPGVRNLYLHKYMGSDDDRALHDHPWTSWSILLWGRLVEVTDKGQKRIWPFIPKYRSATYSHRLILNSNRALTLFYTGKKIREWGFHCPKGWVHWTEFTDEQGNQTGKGCGD